MVNLNHVTAEWARKQCTEMGPKLKKQLDDILTKIADAARENKKEVYHTSIDNLVEFELNKRGFNVKFNNISSIDPRETSYYIISW